MSNPRKRPSKPAVARSNRAGRTQKLSKSVKKTPAKKAGPNKTAAKVSRAGVDHISVMAHCAECGTFVTSPAKRLGRGENPLAYRAECGVHPGHLIGAVTVTLR